VFEIVVIRVASDGIGPGELSAGLGGGIALIQLAFRHGLYGSQQGGVCGVEFFLDDLRLADLVADNLAKHEVTESESLLIGTNFGVGTDIETGPNGNLYVVSLTNGVIYEIFRK
jgi:hypothetical protein